MKKNTSIILLCCIISAIFAGCGNQAVSQEQTSQTTAIGNPWSDWESIEEAESEVGFSFGLPEVIADSYKAVSFRTLKNPLVITKYLKISISKSVRERLYRLSDRPDRENQRWSICCHVFGILTQVQLKSEVLILKTLKSKSYAR